MIILDEVWDNIRGELVKAPDNVNHPSHYMANGLETIDVIEAFSEGLTGAEAFYIGNVVKYISRWKKKNGLEDLEKAKWYLDKLICNIKARE